MSVTGLIDRLARARWVEWLGATGLYLFAFFAWLGPAGAYIGTGLMLLAALAQWPQLQYEYDLSCRRKPLLWVFFFSSVTLALSTVMALWERPLEADSHLNAGADIFKLWGFLLVAWWLRGNQKRLLLVLGLALTGFLLGRLRAFDAAALEAILSWRRHGFGLPILAFGQYSAAALLGLTLLAPRLWQVLKRWPAGWRWPASLGLIVIGLLLLQGVLISQSRGVWLALLTTLIMLLFARKPPSGASGVFAVRVPVKAALAALMVLVVLVNSPVILQRFAFGNGEFFDNLLAGRFEHIDDISVQVRLVMLELGLDWWLQRPWLGWGPGSTPHLIAAAAERGVYSGYSFNDLHNIGLDMLVRLGLLGTLALLAGVVLIFYRLRQACIGGALDRDLYLLLLALLTLHFLCALTNFRVLNGDWRFFWMLVAGAACSFYFHQRPRLERVSGRLAL